MEQKFERYELYFREKAVCTDPKDPCQKFLRELEEALFQEGSKKAAGYLDNYLDKTRYLKDGKLKQGARLTVVTVFVVAINIATYLPKGKMAPVHIQKRPILVDSADPTHSLADIHHHAAPLP